LHSKLGSFSLRFSKLFLCFQVLLSFVPTIFHFLYFPAFPEGRDPPAIPRGSPHTDPRLRQYVHKMHTIVGYHNPRSLSSKKCEKSEPTLPNFAVLPGRTSGETVRCRFSRLQSRPAALIRSLDSLLPGRVIQLRCMKSSEVMLHATKSLERPLSHA